MTQKGDWCKRRCRLRQTDRIIDKSEFTNCNQRCEGLNYVIVGGEVVVENAIYNGIRKGKFIPKSG